MFGILSACIHESGHLLAAYCLNCPPKELVVSCFGMRLMTDDRIHHPVLKDIVIVLAGPLCNILMYVLFAFSPFPSIYANIHLVMAVFNLLPVKPLDGGSAIELILENFVSIKFGKVIENVLFWSVCLCMLGLGTLLLVGASHNVTLLVIGIYLIFMRLFHKCN